MIPEALVVAVTRLLTGVRPFGLATHLEREAPAVFFANHGSHLDFLALWAALPRGLRRRTRPVAAHDYWTAGAIRRYVAERVFRAVLVDRGGATREANPVSELARTLEAGESLILFPEGTRSRDGRLQPFKSGIYHLARRASATEFVPVHLENLNRILPKGELLPVPLLGAVRFGPALRLQDGESKASFLTRALAAIESLAAEGAPRAQEEP